MDITPLGDSALIVRVREQFEDAPEETLGKVLRVFHQLQQAAIPGVIELAPAYTSVAVFFDPFAAMTRAANSANPIDWLTKKIQEALHSARPKKKPADKSRLIEIPVCYDEEFAIDIEDVAQATGIPASEVVNLHSGSEYRVSCIGFTPGFPFLSGMLKNLATPRRSTPRKDIPAGSVGIGGAQTGIYPLRSPGGWNLIGRTPLRLFDPKENPPSLLRAGDRVRFRRITRAEFETFELATTH